MFSGNHSPIHPLDTVLDAARQLHRSVNVNVTVNEKIKFLFVGGGTEWNKIWAAKDQEGLNNVICLPYQPLEKVGASLGAADLHIVAMGEVFVGLVHPCKVYNLLSLGLPWIGIGPKDCHLADLLGELGRDSGCELLGGDDSTALARLIQERAAKPASDPSRLKKVGEQFRQSVLAPKLAGLIAQAGKGG
jgi:hypothetical protein